MFCIIFVINRNSQLVNRVQAANLFFRRGRDVEVLGKPLIYPQSQWYTSLLLIIRYKQTKRMI